MDKSETDKRKVSSPKLENDISTLEDRMKAFKGGLELFNAVYVLAAVGNDVEAMENACKLKKGIVWALGYELGRAMENPFYQNPFGADSYTGH